MLSLSPSLFQTFGWPVEDPVINHDYNNFYADADIQNSILHLPSTLDAQPQVGHGDSSAFEPTAVVKKINHNANERDRRKKMNSLYSSLRSLLPASHQAKKLSIPNTVSRVLKYIPELQNEIERLVRKKEALSVKISKQGELFQYENQRNNSIRGSLSTVSASLIGDKQVTIQMSTLNANMRLQSEALEVVEKDGFELVNASFNSFGERAFYNLHLEVHRPLKITEIESLRLKLATLCDKYEEQVQATSLSFQKI